MKTEQDFTKAMMGYVIEDSSIPAPGEGLKFYIPVLMSGIKKENPKKEISLTYESSQIINASECKPKLSSVIYEQNYITCVRDDNSSISRIISKKNGKNIIPSNTKLECRFLQGNITKKIFKTNIT